MRRSVRSALLALAVAAPLTALSMSSAVADQGAGPQSQQEAYAAAAEEFGVPENVLLGLSYVQSRWDDHAGLPSAGGGYGPMHLTDVPARTVDRAVGARQVRPSEPPLRTARVAAELTGVDVATVKRDPVENIRGGAAVLARYQRDLGLAAGADSAPGGWYAAVAKYGGSSTQGAAESFANQVFAKVRDGVARTTDDGERIALRAAPATAPARQQVAKLGLPDPAKGQRVECPESLGCLWIPAPYEQYGDEPGEYGNHDLGQRQRDLDIEYIVIHDTETDWDTTLQLVQDPEYVSWQYSIRSSDGQVAQHVKNRNVAWQAGNWYINMHSIGIEHEGYVRDATWFTEAMYENSAALVRYLAKKYGVPLDRAHIIGHDQVPATTPAGIAGMHNDPGPYWNWEHYFRLLHAPIVSHQSRHGGVVTIKPGFDGNVQPVTGCGEDPAAPCAEQGSSAVYLHTEPSEDAPLVNDIGLRPDGSPNTTHVEDVGARVSAGAQYAYAGRSGDWTAIWYLGAKAWFHDPRSKPTSVRTVDLVVSPKKGKDSIPFYGRAYPEESAYPDDIPYQTVTPFPYTLKTGQSAVVGDLKVQTDYYFATTYQTPGRQVLGKDKYYEVWMGHRMGFVRAADVDVRLGVVR